MARMPRVVVPCFPHHVSQRGNGRQKTFFGTEDYLYYIDLLFEFSKFAETEIWAYCQMPNHVHLVMVPEHPWGQALHFTFDRCWKPRLAFEPIAGHIRSV